MTVYVDEVRRYGRESIQPAARRWGNVWCHMICDGELQELHAFAARLGLRRAWFQDNTRRPRLAHYDLLPSRRAKALEFGAVEIKAQDWARETLLLAREEAAP